MNAMTVQWHEECLGNFKASLEHEKIVLARQQEKIARMEAEAAFREKQIATAKAKGKESFDMDRFLGGFKWTPAP